jgi:hypothetical protein
MTDDETRKPQASVEWREKFPPGTGCWADRPAGVKVLPVPGYATDGRPTYITAAALAAAEGDGIEYHI